jgi:polar amino acid transport system substrate-binding protein
MFQTGSVPSVAADTESRTVTIEPFEEYVAVPPAQEIPPSLLDEIQDRGVLRLAIYLKSASPLQHPNESTGEAEGMYADVGKLMAEDLGVEAEFVDVPEWSAVIPTLLSGKADLIIAAPSATPERALSIDFPAILVYYDVTALVPADGAVQTVEDLEADGITISVNEGSTQHFYALTNYPNANISSIPGALEARLEVASGRADASFQDSYQSFKFMQEYDGMDVLRDENGDPLVVSREPGSIAIRQGDPRFYNWLENWVRWYREQGVLDGMYDQWMGPVFEGVE